MSSKGPPSKIKKRVREAFPDNDPDLVIKAIVSILKAASGVKKAKPNAQAKSSAQEKESDNPQEETPNQEPNDTDWSCAGRIWLIPAEPCEHGTKVERSKGKTRWGGKLHTLCKGCKKEHEKFKKQNKTN